MYVIILLHVHVSELKCKVSGRYYISPTGTLKRYLQHKFANNFLGTFMVLSYATT